MEQIKQVYDMLEDEASRDICRCRDICFVQHDEITGNMWRKTKESVCV